METSKEIVVKNVSVVVLAFACVGVLGGCASSMSGGAYSREQTRQVQEVEMGVARYAVDASLSNGEFALVVDDRWQHQGIGHKLMNVLMDVARAKGVKVLEGEVLKSNHKMLHLVEGLGFRIEPHPEDDRIKYIVREL